MGQNKEQLKKLLAFIDELAKDKDNAWFVKELGRKYGRPFASMEKLNAVERYLALDFDLDDAPSIIDYSFVSDVQVRNQLISDNREMLRFRYGLRTHKIDFEEFCRYAHMQAESLVNYYYTVSCENYAAAKAKVLKYNSKAIIDEQCGEIEGIPYAYKLKAFIAEMFPSDEMNKWFSPDGQKSYDTLTHVKNIRNGLSHRGKQKDNAQFVERYKNEVKLAGLPWKESRNDLDFAALKTDFRLQMEYDQKFKKSHEKYVFCLWVINKPFDEVLKAIGTIAECVNDKTGEDDVELHQEGNYIKY